MTRSLLIAESPSKAKTLKKYRTQLRGAGFYGHVRDLEAKEGPST
jgi:DNA topoisomerase IA